MSVPIAFRRLAGRPYLFSGLVLAIAIALAIVTALASVVDGLLYRPLPFRDSGQLVVIDYRRDGARPPDISYLPRLAPERAQLGDQLASSPLVSAIAQAGFATFFDVTETRALGIDVTGVDAQFFSLLGVSPAAGRAFTRADERSPAALSRTSALPLPIVISDRLARRFFGSALS
jgi:putative ABC transport system permease protein